MTVSGLILDLKTQFRVICAVFSKPQHSAEVIQVSKTLLTSSSPNGRATNRFSLEMARYCLLYHCIVLAMAKLVVLDRIIMGSSHYMTGVLAIN